MSWVFELLATFAAALFLRLFVVSLARIKGRSMLPTLHDRDVALVWRLGYLLHEPRRGDVVICHYPGRKMKRIPFLPQSFVKRVIGLPGDTVEWLEGELLLNGQPLREPYLDPARCRFKRTRPPLTLGPEEYYVLGDNRDSSNDSRSVGPIRRSMIIGHVRTVLFPFNAMRGVQ